MLPDQPEFGVAFQHAFGHADEEARGNHAGNGANQSLQVGGFILGFQTAIKNMVAIVG